MSKILLISGFEPFGGEVSNPSWEAVECLPDTIGEFTLVKVRLPVVFDEAAERLLAVAEEVQPHAILCVGQAGGGSAITPEMVGINLRHATIPDNLGNQPKDEPVLAEGDTAYFSTLPVRKMAEAILEAGIPAQVSYSAGTFVCNEVLYRTLAHYHGTSTRAAFLHVPYATHQGKTPALPLETITHALTLAILAME